MSESRAAKSLKNARVNLVFYFISLLLAFFSRRVFLDSLGNDFMGLVGTLQNVLGFLNLAELGIGSAIGYVLYKPLFDRDEEKINEIISVFGYLYCWIGRIILSLGIVLAFFLPWIFLKSGFPLQGVFFAYFSFLASSLFGYFLNYKQTLLSADQKNYVITAYFQSASILKTLLQILTSLYTGNYYYWIALDLLFAFVYSIILNVRIRQTYPWLASDIKSGRKLMKKYPEVIKYTKQLFIHRIASFVQSQTASILIYAFVALKTVAYYGNYTIIISKITLLMNNVMDGTSAGVGNLIAEGDMPKIKKVYWELTAFRYFVGGIIVFSLYHLMESFISLWVGEEYVMSRTVLILILIHTYIGQTRNVNDMFLYGYGLFRDVWAPLTEAAVSILVSLAGGYYWGLPGILLGPIISLLLIVGLWKPYFLYRDGFKTGISNYWSHILKYLGILFVSWWATGFLLKQFIRLNPATGYGNWILFAIFVVSAFTAVEFLLMFSFDQGMRGFSYRMKNRLLNMIQK